MSTSQVATDEILKSGAAEGQVGKTPADLDLQPYSGRAVRCM
jgi:hypothetical protein